MSAFATAWSLMKKVYWNNSGNEHTWANHLQYEVGEKGNFGGDPQDPYWREIEHKYSLTPTSMVIWVTEDLDIARTYTTPWDEEAFGDDENSLAFRAEQYPDIKWRKTDSYPKGFPYVHDLPEEEMSRFDDSDGTPMVEIDDGDGGVLFKLGGNW